MMTKNHPIPQTIPASDFFGNILPLLGAKYRKILIEPTSSYYANFQTNLVLNEGKSDCLFTFLDVDFDH